VRRRSVFALILAAAFGAVACGSDESGESRAVSESVKEQLAYLEPESALVVAVDLHYEGENWESLRAVADRLLDETRGVVEPEDGDDFPVDAESALAELAKGWNLSFEEDVRPLMAGHLVIGLSLGPDAGDPEEITTVVYRTDEGNLRRTLEKTLDNSRLRAVPGHDDVVVSEPEGIALVGDDTLVAAGTTEHTVAAVKRSETGGGFPPELLEAAERDAGIPDPLVLATATPDLAGEFFDAESVARARSEVPYLAAVERLDLALDVAKDGLEARARVVTTGARLSDDQLPLGPAGEVELPRAEGAIVGATRDQSRLTTFSARVVRSLFADSDFVRAVEETERELGIRFEDEVLRQFDCPSVSVFEPEPNAELGAGGRFSARSCVRDPDRMRELLPKLAPRLPRILHAMRALSGEGLLGLLLVAPDAPLSPGVLLAQIGVDPLGGGDPDEQLYEVRGLRDTAPGEAVFPGPDRVVFGMVGDDFVVGSDRQAARDAAVLETEPAAEAAASAQRMPAETLAGLVGSREAAEVLRATFGDIEIGFAADPSATRAHARMPLAD
jgi:hypothetical protein